MRLALPLLGSLPILLPACAPAVGPPSIILLSLDTLGARHLPTSGYPRATAPRLLDLGTEALTFEACASNAPWTTPSYLSQMTGLYPESLRLESLPEGVKPHRWNLWWLPPERHTLAEALAAAGYRTAAFIDNPMIGPEFGLDQGFELYDTTALEIQQDDPAGGLRTVTSRALSWVDGLGDDQPFFLFLQALDVHGPYLPDEPFRGAFAGDGLGASRELRVAPWDDVYDRVPAYIGGSLGMEPEGTVEGAELVRAYDEEILAVDDAIGVLLDGLEARGVLETAVFILTADHGEAFGEHGLWCQHFSLHEEVVHVPLFVRMPGAAGGGRVVSERVQLVDLFPTVLELAGARQPDQPRHGRSLVSTLEGGGLAPVPTFATEGLFSQASICSGGWKLIETYPSPVPREDLFMTSPRAVDWLRQRFPDLGEGALTLEGLGPRVGDREQALALYGQMQRDLAGPFHELYRLTDDPLEERDVAADHPDVVEQMVELLEAERARARAARIEERPRGEGLPPEMIERLRDLGYADVGGGDGG